MNDKLKKPLRTGIALFVMVAVFVLTSMHQLINYEPDGKLSWNTPGIVFMAVFTILIYGVIFGGLGFLLHWLALVLEKKE